MSVDYRILGTIEVIGDDGTALALGGARQRRLLAVLLQGESHWVGTDRIIDAVWVEEKPPAGGPKTVATYVSRLRSVLGEGSVAMRGDGYVLARNGSPLDAERFEELVGQARRQPAKVALPRLDEALSLWRGPAFGEFADERWCRPAATRLEELRLVAHELRAQARLDLGDTAIAIAELEGLRREHPLRERFTSLLMLGLQRAGRQSDALRVFQQYRRDLGDEMGLEPSADLVALERRIAVADPSLQLSLTGDRRRGYVLSDVIGEGTFGTVYRGTQPVVGREVAVKVIRAEYADDPDFIARFEAEARLVARLEHPHIVPLYDFWREPGGAYLVMRLLKGGSAEERLAALGALSLADVSRVVDQVGEALAVAHAWGVVHRDVKPANVLYDEVGNAYLADFGIAVDAASTPEPGVFGSAGSPLYAAPEQLRGEPATPRSDLYAFAVLVWELLTGSAPFEAPTLSVLAKEKASGPLPEVTSLRHDVPPAVAALLKAATAPDPSRRIADVGEFVLGFRDAMANPLPSGAATTGSAAVDRPRAVASKTLVSLHLQRGNPFKGLKAFGEEDAADFFGRDEAAQRLATLVEQSRFVAVVGPSGAGKSSLVRAGLVPLLRSRGWWVTDLVPGRFPFDELEAALLRVAPASVNSLMEQLAYDERGLARAIRRVLPDRDQGPQLVIVVDQFEELFVQTEPEVRDRFLAALTAAAADETLPVRIVVTLRADFYDRPLALPGIGELVRDNTVAVTPLGVAELERAITGPVELLGVRVEPPLLAALVTDTTANPGSLPLLQYTLTHLYDRRDGAVLDLETYQQLGGIGGAIASRADEVTDAIGDEQVVRRLFRRLVVPGTASGADARRRARVSELGDVPTSVVDEFGAARLLTFDRDPITREPTIEVAHEALIRNWPRLIAWLDEDRDAIRLHHRIGEAASAWEEKGHEPADLLRGPRLVEANAWSRTHDADLSELERRFVSSSNHADQRGRRRRRAGIAALGAVAVIALIAAVVAFGQRDRADRNATAAAANAEAAAANADLAEQNAAEAAAKETEAVEARDRVALQKLAGDAALVAPTRPDTAMLLAIEAYRRDPGAGSKGALVTALAAEPRVARRISLGGRDTTALRTITSGGGFVATLIGFDGEAEVVLVDAERLEPTGVRLPVGRLAVLAMRGMAPNWRPAISTGRFGDGTPRLVRKSYRRSISALCSRKATPAQ